jgi:TM2 domain-containing membrane protein YozV
MNTAAANMSFCRACGHQVYVTAPACPGCGAPQDIAGVSSKRILPAFLLCFFFGWLGFHRFYVGKAGTGIIMLLTGGLFGIMWFIDTIMLLCSAFKDGTGKKLTQWT